MAETANKCFRSSQDLKRRLTARNSMVNEGLLKPDSPRGVWEVSERGMKWLDKNNRQTKR